MMKIIKKSVIYFVGLLILAFGLALTIKSGLGAGPWPALFAGLNISFGLTVGSWTYFVGGILILVNSFLLKKRPEIMMMVPIIIMGSFIDFWLIFVLNKILIDQVLIQWITLLLGIVLIALGIVSYIQAKIPFIVPIDGFMFSIQRRFNISLGKAKTIAELFALSFAFIFSGPIGWGTIFVAFLVGPLTQVFNVFIPKYFAFIFKEQPINQDVEPQ